MRTIFCIVTLLLGYSVQCFSQESAKYISEKAEKLAFKENYKEALIEYNNCVKIFAEESKYFKVEVLLNKARIEGKLHQFAKAEKSIQDAINIKRNIYLIYEVWGQILSQQNKYSEAANAIDSALFYNNNQTKLYLTKASYQIEAFMADSAIQTINNYLQLYPKDFEAFTMRSTAYIKKQEFNNGLQDVQFVLNKYPDNLEALLNRGIIYAYMNDYEKSENDFNRIISLNSGYKKYALNNIVFFIKFRNQDYTGSLDILNKSIEEFPNDAFLLNNRGYAYLMLKRYKEAEKDLLESLKINPYNNYLYRNLALYYLAIGKESKACANIESAIKLGFSYEYGNELELLKEKHCK